MKNILLVFTLLVSLNRLQAQQIDSSKTWEFSAELNNYILPQEYIPLPIFKADHKHLHLEARYNYEDLQTASLWSGYNFKGGQKLEYTITPMAGLAFGSVNGAGLGLESTLTWRKLEWYNEAEYLFDFSGKENWFFYNWSDLSYSPTDWLYVGLSAQRTRLYQTDLELQRGAFAGVAVKNLELTGYLYNVGFSEVFGLITIGYSF